MKALARASRGKNQKGSGEGVDVEALPILKLVEKITGWKKNAAAADRGETKTETAIGIYERFMF